MSLNDFLLGPLHRSWKILPQPKPQSERHLGALGMLKVFPLRRGRGITKKLEGILIWKIKISKPYCTIPRSTTLSALPASTSTSTVRSATLRTSSTTATSRPRSKDQPYWENTEGVKIIAFPPMMNFRLRRPSPSWTRRSPSVQRERRHAPTGRVCPPNSFVMVKTREKRFAILFLHALKSLSILSRVKVSNGWKLDFAFRNSGLLRLQRRRVVRPAAWP